MEKNQKLITLIQMNHSKLLTEERRLAQLEDQRHDMMERIKRRHEEMKQSREENERLRRVDMPSEEVGELRLRTEEIREKVSNIEYGTYRVKLDAKQLEIKRKEVQAEKEHLHTQMEIAEQAVKSMVRNRIDRERGGDISRMYWVSFSPPLSPSLPPPFTPPSLFHYVLFSVPTLTLFRFSFYFPFLFLCVFILHRTTSLTRCSIRSFRGRRKELESLPVEVAPQMYLCFFDTRAPLRTATCRSGTLSYLFVSFGPSRQWYVVLMFKLNHFPSLSSFLFVAVSLTRCGLLFFFQADQHHKKKSGPMDEFFNSYLLSRFKDVDMRMQFSYNVSLLPTCASSHHALFLSPSLPLTTRHVLVLRLVLNCSSFIRILHEPFV